MQGMQELELARSSTHVSLGHRLFKEHVAPVALQVIERVGGDGRHLGVHIRFERLEHHAQTLEAEAMCPGCWNSNRRRPTGSG
jgi:hypothetical protein